MNCEVCEAEPSAGVACSPLGPISIAYGRKCLTERAEPLWLLCCALDAGNLEELKSILKDGCDNYPDWWVLDIKVFSRGKYMDIVEWANA